MSALLGVAALTLGMTAVFACGQASIKVFVPCPTPTGVDITFKGVQAVFQSQDCFNGGACHNKANGGASGLVLGGDQTTPMEIYTGVLAGGSQGPGTNISHPGPGDHDVVIGSGASLSLLLRKPLANDPLGVLTHQGGKQFGSVNTPGYKSIYGWTSNGALAPVNGGGGC